MPSESKTTCGKVKTVKLWIVLDDEGAPLTSGRGVPDLYRTRASCNTLRYTPVRVTLSYDVPAKARKAKSQLQANGKKGGGER